MKTAVGNVEALLTTVGQSQVCKKLNLDSNLD